MYHNVIKAKVSKTKLDIPIDLFEKQLQYLSNKGYTTYHFSELDKMNNIHPKSIIITFDDVALNQLELAIPLLEKYRLKATFFIPFHYIGKTADWYDNSIKIMNLNELKSLNNDLIEFGNHSYYHRAYTSLSSDEIQDDLILSHRFCIEHDLKVSNILAYPYGSFPKKDPLKGDFFSQLEKNNIKYGLRIGNRINKYPFKNPFEINRIEVKGDRGMFRFKYMLKVGKLI